MRTISILTPVSRPENIIKIRDDFRNYTDRIKILWYLCYDKSCDIETLPFIEDEKNLYIVKLISPYDKAVGGHLHRNYILNNMRGLSRDRWVYFLDDDNTLSEGFVNFFVDDALDQTVYMFSQLMPDGRKRIAGNETMRIGYVDTAQPLCRLYCLDNFQFQDIYEADGRFVLHLWNTYKHSFKFLEHNFVYYNKLRPCKEQ